MLLEILLIVIGFILVLNLHLYQIVREHQPTLQADHAETKADDMTSSSGKDLKNIYYVAWMLRQKLVPDVVAPIMHHAGFFQRHVKSVKSSGNPWVISQRQAPYTCLATDPIQSSARLQNPVRKVVFAIQSCDQGYVNNPNSASYTWFTAGVMPKLEEDTGDDAGPRLEQLSTRDGDGNDRFIDQERQIYRNDIANRYLKTHIVEWTGDSDDESERRWVRSLRNGDRLIVRAWAQYPGVSERAYLLKLDIFANRTGCW